MAAASTDSMVCVAQISAAHGVRGALKLRCFTEEPENVAAYGPLCDAHGRELFRLTVLNRISSGLIVRVSFPRVMAGAPPVAVTPDRVRRAHEPEEITRPNAFQPGAQCMPITDDMDMLRGI